MRVGKNINPSVTTRCVFVSTENYQFSYFQAASPVCSNPGMIKYIPERVRRSCIAQPGTHTRSSSLRCSMEGQPPRNRTASIATGGLDSETEEVSDFVRDSDDSVDDGLPYRPAAYQANTHATSHRTRGASRVLSALAQTPSPSPAQPLQPPPPPPPPPQQQPQHQQQPPPPLPASSQRCIAIKKSGENAGSVCGNISGGRRAGYCRHHDGMQKRRKVAAVPSQPGGSGDGEEPSYESDGDLVGGVDELQTQGAESQQSKNQEAHYGKAEKIAAPGFSAAYKTVWHLKKQKVSKPKVSFCFGDGRHCPYFRLCTSVRLPWQAQPFWRGWYCCCCISTVACSC